MHRCTPQSAGSRNLSKMQLVQMQICSWHGFDRMAEIARSGPAVQKFCYLTLLLVPSYSVKDKREKGIHSFRLHFAFGNECPSTYSPSPLCRGAPSLEADGNWESGREEETKIEGTAERWLSKADDAFLCCKKWAGSRTWMREGVE